MASRLFTVDLDLGLNKAKRFIFEDFSSAPTGTAGRVIYWTAGDSAQNHLKVYNGSAWKTVAYTDDLTAGTVTSVGIAFDTAAGNVFGVSNSPITSSGDITLSLDTQTSNYVFAGPTTGSSAAPTFRALVDADIPADIARSADLPVAGTDYIAFSEKGAPLGVAELNASGYVPSSQLDLSSYLTTESDPVFTASVAFGITTTNTTNWDAAYSWGDHSLEGYLTSETDPVFTASAAFGITTTNISNWNTAYGWGNHASAGYLTSAVESISNTDDNIVFSAASGTITADLASDITLLGDLSVNGGDITTTSTSASIFNTNALTLNIGGDATTVALGSTTTGTVTIGNHLTVNGNLTVNGTTTTLNTDTLAVEDNLIVLNSNITGTPSLDAGIEVERGTSDNATLIWDEDTDKWAAGLSGSELAIARKYSLSINTTGGTAYQITHNLGTSDVIVQTYLSDSLVDCDVDIISDTKVSVTTNSSETSLKVVVIG
jgi:hypothetical protein